MKEQLLKIRDVADILGVSLITLRRWEKKGLISSVRVPGGHRKYRVTDIENIVNSRLPNE